MAICYLGLGGNIGDSFAVMEKTVRAIAKLDQVWEVEVSRPFLTTPVSSVEQRDYLNAVCRLRTSLTPTELFSKLEEIESAMGKVAKPKEEPRVIDIDMLFYGQKRMESDKLSLPHPRW
ncbi:MAG: 2-amino-4-hydroxy-6-hydroxymethyldihydropteridine pyrophosphokinase, partial [Chlamydiae bacterium]|nr:2-amino-4-hydroxy-6-hydroxymethyldihydropteridine pyrophosphokinase [Chlamydiota bacterium]